MSQQSSETKVQNLVREDKTHLDIRGDEVEADAKTGTLKSKYLNSAENLIKKLNEISPSMCLAKWYYASVNLTAGRTQSCYHPPSHVIPLSELENNPAALHNTKYKKAVRALMRQGQRPSECEHCWQIEKSNDGQAISDRAYRSADVYTEELFGEAARLDPDVDVSPRFLEVSFTQQCQMKCSYCSPHLSSAWQAEVESHGAFKISDRVHNDLNWLTQNGLMPDVEKSKAYVKSFWQWWPELYKSLKHFKLTGGEPLLDENTFQVFDAILQNPKKDLQLSINSNCSVSTEVWQRFVQKIKQMGESHSVDHFMLFASLDSVGLQAEYIRFGMQYLRVVDHIADFLSRTERTSVTMVITVNALSVVGLKKLLQQVLKWRRLYSKDRQKIWLDVPVLDYPNWLSVKNLTPEYLKYIEETLVFMRENEESLSNRFQGFKDFEIAKVEAIYLMLQRQLNESVGLNFEEARKNRIDLIQFLYQHDAKRGTNHREVFPEMQTFFNQCEMERLFLKDASDREENFFELSPQTYTDFKKKVMDPISPSFCAAKWYNATVWLGAGTTASCHHPTSHRIPLDELAADHKALHNTKFKKEQRRMMLEGVRPPECEYCWKIEDLDKSQKSLAASSEQENISDRVFKTIIYKEADIQQIANTSVDQNINLKTLEISFDRTCQLACSYCSGGFSSTWVKDIQKNGSYENLQSDQARHYSSTNDWGQLYSAHESNPYVDAFWKWWPELSETLFELRVTGGEPLLSPSFWKLVDWFSNQQATEIRFATNTNLSVNDDLIQKLISKSHQIKYFDLYTSCEATEVAAEYIRDGLNYSRWKQNLINCIEQGRFRRIMIMMTINLLCLDTITDFLDEMIELKKKYGRNYPSLSLNILRYPSFQSPAILPKHLKQLYADKLKCWLGDQVSSEILNQVEIESVSRLIHYLEQVTEPHPQALHVDILRQDFKSFYNQYDQRRSKNFHDVFVGSLSDWAKSL